VDKNGKSRELHTDLAVDAIDYRFFDNYKTLYSAEVNRIENLVECPYFSTNVLHFDKPVRRDYTLNDSFVIYICIEGRLGIKYKSGVEQLTMGETILIPASLDEIILEPESASGILEVTII
jgi:mannose-6-phosphate isomerase